MGCNVGQRQYNSGHRPSVGLGEYESPNKKRTRLGQRDVLRLQMAVIRELCYSSSRPEYQ